jgi:hypothetical protein
MAVLLLAPPIVRHRDRFAQSDERAVTGGARMKDISSERENIEVRTPAFSLAITLARDARDSQTVR